MTLPITMTSWSKSRAGSCSVARAKLKIVSRAIFIGGRGEIRFWGWPLYSMEGQWPVVGTCLFTLANCSVDYPVLPLCPWLLCS